MLLLPALLIVASVGVSGSRAAGSRHGERGRLAPGSAVVVAAGSGLPSTLTLTAAARASPARRNVGALSYERWVRPYALGPLERHLAHTVNAWGEHRDSRLVYDARLGLVARSALGEVPRVTNGRVDLESLRARAYRLGWTDGELAVVTVRAAPATDLDATVTSELTARLGTMTPTCFGVAAKVEGNERIVMVLVSRRLVRLWPMPAAVARGERLTIAGSVIASIMGPAAGSAASQSGKSLPGVILAIGLQDGTVQRRSVALKGLAFETQVEAGSAVGLLDIQLLVDRGRGPEIAAQFPVGVGRRVDEPRAAVAPEPALDQTAADGVAPEDLGRRLAALVLGSRQAAGVALPASSTALDEVASSHVADMRASGFFAHVSPRYGDLPHRLARRGVIVTRSLENIARAHDIDEVLRQWLASPAHRANLLDPDIDAFGVDAEVTNRGEVLAVLVLCRRADEGDNTELAHRALVRINAERLRQGLTALAWDEDLARLAETHSRESAQGYTADDVVARVARELDCDNAAANVFVGTALDPVTHSPEVLAAYERAGIGVVRTNPHDPRLWITVIYAAE